MPETIQLREDNIALTVSRNRFRAAFYSSMVVLLLLAASLVLVAFVAYSHDSQPDSSASHQLALAQRTAAIESRARLMFSFCSLDPSLIEPAERTGVSDLCIHYRTLAAARQFEASQAPLP